MVLRLVNYNNPGLRSLTLNFFHVKNNENTVENNNKKKKNSYSYLYVQIQCTCIVLCGSLHTNVTFLCLSVQTSDEHRLIVL